MLNITVIGTGAVGSALLNALHGKPDYQIKSIFNKTVKKAEDLAKLLNVTDWDRFPKEADQLGDIVFLTVPDDRIRSVCKQLSELEGGHRDRVFVHCSGVHTNEALKELKELSAYTVAWHPLQTFSVNSRNSFDGIFCSFQGDQKALYHIRKITKCIGAQLFRINKKDKALLHVSAVFASNYLVTLLYAAEEVMEESTIGKMDILQKISPLVSRTLQNSINMGPKKALSGPIARNDIGTVHKHLSLIDNDSLDRLYRELGQYTIQMLQREREENASSNPYEAMMQLLTEER